MLTPTMGELPTPLGAFDDSGPEPIRALQRGTRTAAFTALFLAVFLLRMVVIIPNLVADYPARVGGLVRDLSTPPHTPATGRLSSVLGPTYVLLGITFALVRLSVRAVYAVRPAVARRTRGLVGS